MGGCTWGGCTSGGVHIGRCISGKVLNAHNPGAGPNPRPNYNPNQDKDEQPATLSAGLPVVSLSIGDACDFAYAPVPDPHAPASSCDGEFPGQEIVRLESGDALVFGGPARMMFHGVKCVHPETHPDGLVLRPGRLNLTFRQYTLD